MAYARSVVATVAAISCNQNSEMSKAADIAIEPVVGPEVVTGSSRMKAGTAQKLILNMITTGAMIRSGKVYSNLMVDVEATNAKLVQRQVNIVVEATECTPEEAENALNECQRHCKTAIVMILGGLTAQQAAAVLSKNKGFIRKALEGIQA
jgi:N-acetylmuramic acid 6-phosphate etherase